MAAKGLTDGQLLSRIRGEITDSLGYGDTISKQRETAMEYYYDLLLKGIFYYEDLEMAGVDSFLPFMQVFIYL